LPQQTEDFNIRDNDWNLSYPHHSVHAGTLGEVTDSFNLKLLIPIIYVPTRYMNNSNDFNSVIDLMFLQANAEEFDTHTILLDL